MKKLLLPFLFLGITTITNAQTWVQQTSGTVSQLNSVSFVDANNGFVSGANNTVLKTTNGGTAWSSITTATIGTTLNFKEVYFVNPTTGWLLSDIGVVLKTSDAGATWLPCNTSSLTPMSTWSKMHFSDVNNGFISGVANFSVQLAKTIDGGLTWTNVPFTTSVSSIAGIQALANNSVMISADNKIYYSTNAGTTWTTSSAITPTSSLLGEVKAFDFSSAFVTNRTNGNSLVYKSSLYPFWNTSSNGLTNGGYQNIDAFDANNVMISNFSSGFIHKTTDGGLNWSQETMPTTVFINDLKYISPNKAWIVGSGGIILAYGSTVGFKEISREKNIEVYPNPTNSNITISSENKLGTLKITNMYGAEVLSLDLNETNSTIDLSDLKSGIYFIQTNNSVKKLIKK